MDDFAAAYNYALDSGYEAVIDSGVDGLARMSYMENPDTGIILEVIEWNALTRPYFDGLEKKVKSADKSVPVHEFELSDITPRGAVMLQLAKFMVKKALGRVEQTRRPNGAAA